MLYYVLCYVLYYVLYYTICYTMLYTMVYAMLYTILYYVLYFIISYTMPQWPGAVVVDHELFENHQDEAQNFKAHVVVVHEPPLNHAHLFLDVLRALRLG